MIAKIHNSNDGKRMIAICDDELLGKKFSEGDKQLDLTGEFYKGSKISKEDLLIEIKKAYLLNVIGEKSVDFLINEKIVDKEQVIFVDHIAHAQVVISEGN